MMRGKRWRITHCNATFILHSKQRAGLLEVLEAQMLQEEASWNATIADALQGCPLTGAV